MVKARTTRRPESRSPIIRLIRSSFDWSTLNLGITRKKASAIISRIASTARAMVQDSGTLVRRALMTAPIPMIGAKQASRRIITVDCCTHLHIVGGAGDQRGVENRSSSAAEKAVTRRNSVLRMSLEDLAATRAEKSPASPVQITTASATSSMMAPVL